MERTESRLLSMSLRPVANSPEDMPPGVAEVTVPMHPAARPARPDQGVSGPLMAMAYIKRSDPVGYYVPLDVPAAFAWFDSALADSVETRGRSHSVRDTSIPERLWMRAKVSEAGGSEGESLLMFRPDAGGTLVTWLAEVYPWPPRPAAAYLEDDVDHVDVAYTMWYRDDGPHTRQRSVTDPAAIRSLVAAINALPCDVRSFATGGADRCNADLYFVTAYGVRRHVYVESSHLIVRVDEFPGLFGSVWAQLEGVAPL